MLNFLKKYKDYFLVVAISLLIFIALFISKGIYPFGNNTLIFGDMYDQITAYYYYLYDCIRGNESIFINFASSNGVNFWGIISYYLLSPFSLLILLVERSKIHLFISIIIVLKIIICNLTCLYMNKKLFKNTHSLLSVLLAILYGFSAYSINYYQITSWIDVMYMLPLIVIGLKKLFDEDNPKMYILTLILSLFFSFYISFMIIIFIFLLSIIYIYVYHRKSNFGKKILNLGISTILSIACGLIILIPTYKQISISSRMDTSLETLINSKLGPLTDKITLFLFGPLLFVSLFLLIKDYKKHKDFLKFFVPSMTLLLIPIIVEPINKLLHFGSYACFTYRFGFITTLFIIIGAGYFFNCYKFKKVKIGNINKFISLLITIITTLITIAVSIKYYKPLQEAIDSLTISNNKLLLLMLMIVFIFNFISILIIFILNKGINKYSLSLITLLTIVHISCNAFDFIGIDKVQLETKVNYDSLNLMVKDYDKENYFRYKDESGIIINNASMVNRFPSLDHFSSLTNGQNQLTLKALGYTSYWTHTHSLGGTKFSDALMGNKYIVNTGEKVNDYTFKKQYNELYLHEVNYDISYGYFVKDNISIKNFTNTFEMQNALYQSITGDKNLFEIVDDIKYHNINVDDNTYTIKDNNYIEFKVKIKDKSQVYLELYSGLSHSENKEIFELFNIYLNDELYFENFPNYEDNGLIDFGIYEDDEIIVKIEFLENCYLGSLNIGVMNLNKFYNFIDNNNIKYDLNFNENNINININTDEEKLLFIPINYDESYTAYNNGKKIDIIKVYDNYIGINLNEGENNISIKFIPSYLKISTLFSLFFIILTILLLKTGLYSKLLENRLLQKLAKYIYLGIYSLVIIFIYLIPIIIFLISFVKYINL